MLDCENCFFFDVNYGCCIFGGSCSSCDDPIDLMESDLDNRIEDSVDEFYDIICELHNKRNDSYV